MMLDDKTGEDGMLEAPFPLFATSLIEFAFSLLTFVVSIDNPAE